MKVSEAKELITIGFGQPKLYKRSVWNKAIKIMNVLVEKGKVVRCNNGPGLEKYTTAEPITERGIAILALDYIRTLGVPTFTVEEAVPELEQIAEELGVKVNNGIVLSEYFNRHPEEKSNNK